MEKIPEYVGWYRPHRRVQWTGEKFNLRTGELVKEPSRTKQSFKDECNINNIIKAFSVTGIMTHINAQAAKGAYADLPDPLDYQESLNLVMAAESSFSTLPASVRNRFQNDPTQFLAFMSDPANQAEAIKLGLAIDNRPAEPPPQTTGGDGGSPPSEAPKAP